MNIKPKISLRSIPLKPQYNFIEVCAGCGGLSSGFIKAGFYPLLLNEIDKTCCLTLEKNHPKMNIIQGSMVDLNLKSYYNQVDILMGGVPCQSFSQAGQRHGLDDKRGDLIIQFRQLINDVFPKIFLIENVKGLLTHDQGKTLTKVLTNLNHNDDYVVSYQVLNANDYEVPQKRERVIIIGIRKDINYTWTFPSPISPKLVLKDVLTNCPVSIGAVYSENKRKIMELIPQGGCWINLPEDLQKSYMGQSYFSSGGKRGIARRLSLTEPCLTLTTSPCQKQTERIHPLETRPLNIREYARIQTFSDDYEFMGSLSQQYKQIGNAVPVQLSYHLAIALKKFLDQL